MTARYIPALLVLSVLAAACSGQGEAGPDPTTQPSVTTIAPPSSDAPGSTATATTAAPAPTEAPTTTAAPVPEWSIGEIVPIGVEGVSPEIILRDDGSYLLLVTGQPGGAYTSPDGRTFSPDASVTTPPGADFSLLQNPDGSWRLYYVDFQPIGAVTPGQPPDPNNVLKVVKVTTAASLGNFGPGQPTGIGQTEPGPAWGVPDTYTLPDGRTAMLYVDLGDGGEQVVLATSPDGLRFTIEPLPAFTGGYVDPYVIALDDGGYLGLLSTTPGRPPQRIHLATSPDGVTWTLDEKPFLVDSAVNYLDPAAVQIGPDEWLLVISTAVGDPINGRHELAVTTLTRSTG